MSQIFHDNICFLHGSVALAEDHALIQQEAILNSLKLDILAFILVVCHLPHVLPKFYQFMSISFLLSTSSLSWLQL